MILHFLRGTLFSWYGFSIVVGIVDPDHEQIDGEAVDPKLNHNPIVRVICDMPHDTLGPLRCAHA